MVNALKECTQTILNGGRVMHLCRQTGDGDFFQSNCCQNSTVWGLVVFVPVIAVRDVGMLYEGLPLLPYPCKQ
jgi:hypothetical protein